MGNKDEVLKVIAEALEGFREALQAHGIDGDISYVFCCSAKNKETSEYLAGYSWDVLGRPEFETVISIMESAYNNQDDGKWELFNEIPLN